MKITICASLSFTQEMKKIADELKYLGFEVLLPATAERILNGEITINEIENSKNNGTFHERTIKFDAVRKNYNKIKDSDAILVLNYNKNGIKNYICGSVFLQIGFANVLDKKIYLLNDIPDLSYSEEIKATQPKVINGDLNKIK